MINSKKFGLSEKNFEYILKNFKKFPSIKSAKIFGSRAIGNFKEGSDIDIALFGKISIDEKLKLKYFLEEEGPSPYFFDILIFSEIQNEELKKHIEECGIKIF